MNGWFPKAFLKLDWCPGVQRFDSHPPHKPVGSKTSGGRLSTTLAVKGCILSSQQERSFKWMMMKRGKVDKQGEFMVASYRYLGVSNPGLQMIGSNECAVSCL